MEHVIIGTLAVAILIVLYFAIRTWTAKPMTPDAAAKIAARPTVPTTPNWVGSLQIETAGQRGAWLEVLEGPQIGRTYFLGERTLTIGRSTTHPIQLSDRDVSRSHCRITYADGIYKIADMGSGNGTWINGDRIDSVPIEDGDDLKVGVTVLRFLEDVLFQIDYTLTRKEVGGVFETATSAVNLNEGSGEGSTSMGERLKEIQRLTQAARDGLPSGVLLDAIAISLREQIGAQRTIVLHLVNESWNVHSFHHARDLPRAELRIPPDKPLMSRVALSGKGMATKSFTGDRGLLCAIATPVQRDGGKVGVLYADRIGEGESEFHPQDLEYLEAMADLVESAI